MYAQAAIKQNTLLRNGAYGIVMRGVQKCTCAGASLRGRNSAPLCCIKLDTATDPAAGTFGFMIAADHYLKEKYDDFFDLSPEEVEFQKKEALSGMELVPNTHKLALMNALLHDIEGRLDQGDSLSANGKWMKDFDLVLTNPPFGTKKGASVLLVMT